MEALELRRHLQKELKFFKKRRFERMNLLDKFSYIEGVAAWYFSFFPTSAKEKLAVKELREVESNASGLSGLYEEYKEKGGYKSCTRYGEKAPLLFRILNWKNKLSLPLFKLE